MTATTKKAGTKQRKDRAAPADNMRIWESVCETDPAYTTRINQRGGFTAICAMYQRQEATRRFGPEGEGWGYDATLTNLAVGERLIALVELRLWWRDEKHEIRYCGPVWDSAEWEPRGRYDSDAAKKATTGALTKALGSGLGFNADVFLGKFDDNKYIEQQKEKFSPFAEAAKIQQHQRAGKKHTVESGTASIKAIIDIQPLYELLVIIDCDTWSSKTKEQVSNTFAGRAEKEGVPFDAAFIKAQCEQAQAKIDSMEQDT